MPLCKRHPESFPHRLPGQCTAGRTREPLFSCIYSIHFTSRRNKVNLKG